MDYFLIILSEICGAIAYGAYVRYKYDLKKKEPSKN